MIKAFLNGQFIDLEQALIPATDSGVLYGAGLFETMRAENGNVFAIDDHLERLFTSASLLAIPITYTKEEIKNAIHDLLNVNHLTSARLRLTVTSGTREDQNQKPNLFITAAQLIPYPQEYYQNGIKVVLTNFKQNPSDPLSGHKTTSYYSRLLALNAAHQKHASEALWFTTENRLAEGCISNVFLVKDKKLLTPPLVTPVLPGITRKAVIEIAQHMHIPTEETSLFINDLLGADEVFVTNVIMQIMPVVGIEKHTVKEGKPGPITHMLMKELAEKMGTKGAESDENQTDFRSN